MGMETAEWYNNFCLIGHTEKRSKAWHYQEAMQGDEPNHYPGPVPYADVVRRLFDWKPIITRTANLLPCKKDDVELWLPKLDSENQPIVNPDTGKQLKQPFKVIEVPDMRGVVRSDNYLELGHHSQKYRIHDYEEWLLKLQSNVISDTLDIWSAILLRNGAQACVQAALPETVKDGNTGMEFVPYIHAYTSLDGSLSTTFAAQCLLIVCDNTMYAANNRAERRGRQYRAKHTAGSLALSKISEVQQALGIIHQEADNAIEFFGELAAIKVTKAKAIEVVDIIFPPAVKDDSDRTKKSRETKRDLIISTYTDDEMANVWKGTALGVMQAINTYATHYTTVRGGSRTQRNADKIIRGEFAKVDQKTLEALAKVLDKPELVEAN